MDTEEDVIKTVLQEASPRSRAAIQVALTEDFEEETNEGLPFHSNLKCKRNDFALSRRKRRAFLSSDSEDESCILENSSGSSASYPLEGLALPREFGHNNFEGLAPSTSRPRRIVTTLAIERKNRNRVLMRQRINRRCPVSPPLITLDSSISEDDINGDLKKKKKKQDQEEADYQFAVKVSTEWNKNSEINSVCSQHPDSKWNELGMDFGGQHCVICFEEPRQPVGCIYCRQMIGCRACILKWRRTTNISNLNRTSPLSRGISSTNHKSCPLCRVEWEDVPEVAPWEDFLIEDVKT